MTKLGTCGGACLVIEKFRTGGLRMANAPEITKHMLPAFATPIVNYRWSDAEALNRELTSLILDQAANNDGITKSNVGGRHSPLDFLDSAEKCVRQLRQRLEQLTTELLRQVMRTDAIVEDHRFGLEGWANVLRFGQYNTAHNHPNAFWSGVYYVTENDVLPAHPFSGKLELMDPRPGASLAYSEKTNLYGRFLVNPSAGQTILLPAWLMHQVHPYFGDKQRISIAFNVVY